jgi:precorrin-6B methylase 2
VIGENISRFRTANVELVEGIAPGAMRDLPPAHSIIIGGGGGKLREILEESKRKLLPQGVVVVTAIFLETVGTALASLENLGFRDIEVVQVAVSKAKVVGGKHMMTAQNPVYIIRGRK